MRHFQLITANITAKLPMTRFFYFLVARYRIPHIFLYTPPVKLRAQIMRSVRDYTFLRIRRKKTRAGDCDPPGTALAVLAI